MHEQRKFRADPLKLKRLRISAGLTVNLSGWFETSNGLQYQLAGAVGVRCWIGKSKSTCPKRATDCNISWLVCVIDSSKDKYARGKCYELRHLPCAEQTERENDLLRHAEVCERVGSHANIPENLTAAKIDGLWWVLDRWEAGVTLADFLLNGPLGSYTLRFVMNGIADGLSALHRVGVLRRELSPQAVLLRDSDDRPILMDLELSKLTEGGPSVSPDDWPDDPYRALEVDGNQPIDERADVYSWGRIFVHAATGRLPDRGAEDLTDSELPDRVKELVMDCVAIGRSERPANIEEVRSNLKGWHE